MATIAYNGVIYGNDTVELTRAEYEALGSSVLTDGRTYFITDAGAAEGSSAKDVAFNNNVSGLDALNVQDAIDELAKGGNSGGNSIDLTEAEYLALQSIGDIKSNTTYYIIDGKNEGEDSEESEKRQGTGVVEITQAAYDNLSEEEKMSDTLYAIVDGDNLSAKNMAYDGSKTKLGSSVQTAIDGLFDRTINENLLINSNFTDPVVQRSGFDVMPSTDRTHLYDYYFTTNEANEEVEIYTIDRWIIKKFTDSASGGLATMRPMSAYYAPSPVFGIKIFGDPSIGNGWVYFGQYLEKLDYGKYTFSINIEEKIHSIVLDYQSAEDIGAYTDEGTYLGISTREDGIPFVYIALNLNNISYGELGMGAPSYPVARLYWAKLEKGEIATPYKAKAYTEEYLDCCRYYQPFTGQMTFGGTYTANDEYWYSYTPKIPMRLSTPTVEGTFYTLTGKGSGSSTNISLTNIILYVNYCSLKFNNNISAGTYAFEGFLDAEL